jgi:hypothetical protein
LGCGRARGHRRRQNQLLCFALALWNVRDPILKERLFGLTKSEGNHGEDVKEYYFTSIILRPTLALSTCINTLGRLTKIFLRDASGRRPVYGETQKFQIDPLSTDYVLFYEYFQSDNGAGLGASHQTESTRIVAKLIELS